MRKIVFKGRELYVSEDAKHFYNKYGHERKIFVNRNRQNRRYICFNGNQYPLPILIAIAFPEICGEYFEGCVVHHKDEDVTNNEPHNLQIMSKEEHKKIHWGVIQQLSLSGELIATYSSSIEAGKAMGFTSGTSIRDCICGKSKTCGGYRWKRVIPS